MRQEIDYDWKTERNSTRRAGRAAHHSEGLHVVAAWLAQVGPKREAADLIQRITKKTLRATEAWTDGRQAEDVKYVELNYELLALANVTESAARSTVLKVAQAEPSHGFVAW